MSNTELIMRAAFNGYLEIVQTLLDQGVSVNGKNDYGNAPIHWATMNGHLDVVQCLVQNGADIEIKDNQGDTPLHIAMYNFQYKLAEYYLQAGVKVDPVNDAGLTPLHAAIQSGFTVMVKLLLEAGADYNKKSEENGDTPMDMAAIVEGWQEGSLFNPNSIKSLLQSYMENEDDVKDPGYS